jgi:hypothetical protein
MTDANKEDGMTENIHHRNQSSVSPKDRRRFRRWLWILLGVAVLLTVVLGVELAENILLQHRAGPLSGAPVAFSPDGRTLAMGFIDANLAQHVELWDVQSGSEVRTFSS